MINVLVCHHLVHMYFYIRIVTHKYENDLHLVSPMGAMDDNTDYRFREGLVSLWTVRYTEIPKISPMVYVHMGLYVCLGVHSHSIFHKAYKVVVDWEKNSLLAQGTILP